MKVSSLLGERFKTAPADCTIESQALMVRGGYMKYIVILKVAITKVAMS